MSARKRRWGYTLAFYMLLLMILAGLATPVLWGIFSSFRTTEALFVKEHIFRLDNFTLRHYEDFLQNPQLFSYLKNSFFVALASSLSTLLLATLGGYGLSRYPLLRGRQALITLLFSARVFPFVLILVPVYTIFSQLGLVDTHLGLVLAHTTVTLPFALWIAKAYFDQIPKDLEEAAFVDGSSRLGTWWRIMLPLSAPGLVVIAFYAFTISWGDYLMASLLASSPTVTTLPLGLVAMANSTTSWGVILAMTVFSMLPPILLFAFLQRWFIAGLSGN